MSRLLTAALVGAVLSGCAARSGNPVEEGTSGATGNAGPTAEPCPEGQARCPRTGFNAEPESDYVCKTLVDGRCPAPDLKVWREYIADDTDGNVLHLETVTFGPNDPEVLEGCVAGAGARRVLRFNFAAVNVGTENLNVGRPDERDMTHWEFFEPHGHFHVKGWGEYSLRGLDGRAAGQGRKQSFCLEDNIRTSDMSPTPQFPAPLCETFDPRSPYDQRPEFGLSVGWGDEYPADVRCQWVDIGAPERNARDFTPDGFYDLVVTVNPGMGDDHLYRERDYSNNTAIVRVEIRGEVARPCHDRAGEACPGGTVQCDGSCGA